MSRYAILPVMQRGLKSTISRLGLVVSAAMLLFSFMPHAYAQESGGSGLSVSPTRQELTVNPGAADVVTITLKNISGVDVVAKAEVNDFEAANETGEPKILVNTSDETARTIRNFLVGVSDVELKKDETKKITIPVQIPTNTPSGAYYGVVRYTAKQKQSDANVEKQVALNASLGVITLITVPGQITEQIQAVRITAERDGKASSFFFQAPEKVAITLKNTGNGFVKPFGRVAVSKGGKEVYHYEMNNTDPRSNILPDTVRTFKDEIKDIGGFGRYTVTANLSYGKGGTILTLKTSFWIIPIWALALLAALVVLLIVLGLVLYKYVARRRSRSRR